MSKLKLLIASVTISAVALTAVVPVASAADGKGQVKSNKGAVSRVVGFSEYNRGRLDTLVAAVTCEQFDGAVADVGPD